MLDEHSALAGRIRGLGGGLHGEPAWYHEGVFSSAAGSERLRADSRELLVSAYR
jgi:hypothetical protein